MNSIISHVNIVLCSVNVFTYTGRDKEMETETSSTVHLDPCLAQKPKSQVTHVTELVK